MSAEEFAIDVIHGNFSHALSRLEDWAGTLPPSVKAEIALLETDAGKLAQSLGATAAKDIIAGGIFSTASYVTAANDIVAQVTAQGLTILLPDVFAIVNREVSYLLGQTISTTAPETVPVP